MRASAVRVREQFVLARYGKLARETFRKEASRELAQLLATPGDVWVDFDLFVEATGRVCSLFGDGTPTLARAVGAFGAEANMGPWRSLVHRLLSPKVILEVAGMLWSHHYDAGRLVTTARGDTEVSLKIQDFPRPHLMHCMSVEGWCERTLAFGRPKHVSVHQASCRARGDDCCELIGRWE